MAGSVPKRSPSVCALSPHELVYERVELSKVHTPVNAIILAENELIFLEIARSLEELKAVVIGRVGYVYFGKIHRRVVSLLKPRCPTAVIQCIKILKPRAAIFLGFCKSLQVKSNAWQGSSLEVGDVLVAETLLRKSPKHGKLESHHCSEYLVNVFEHGKFGWTLPKNRKQTVHVGSVAQMGDFTKNEKGSAMAEKTTNLDVAECCKSLDKEWISVLGVISAHRCHSSRSWENYVAVVMSSFVNRVLQDDQVFAILEGESLELEEHISISCHPQQESVSLEGYEMSPGCDITQEQVQKRAELYWARIKEAFDRGLFHPSQSMRGTLSEMAVQNAEHSTNMMYKNPVENSDEKIAPKKTALGVYDEAASFRNPHLSETQSGLPFEGSQRVTLPPLPSNISEMSAAATAPPLQRRVSVHARASRSFLTSSMVVGMRAALMPLGASLRDQGSHFEIIRITSEERASVSRQGKVLPPITEGQTKR